MLDRGVIGDEVHEHADAALVCRRHQRPEILLRAVLIPQLEIVGDLIAEVTGQSARDGGEPERADTEIGQVVQPRCDSIEPRRIEVARDDTVDDRVAIQPARSWTAPGTRARPFATTK
jgi:hypothetical protein